jgi:transposase
VSKTTVQALLQRKQATGTLKPAPATGGKASPLAGYEQDIAEMVERHQDYTLAEYCEYWQDLSSTKNEVLKERLRVYAQSTEF